MGKGIECFIDRALHMKGVHSVVSGVLHRGLWQLELETRRTQDDTVQTEIGRRPPVLAEKMGKVDWRPRLGRKGSSCLFTIYYLSSFRHRTRYTCVRT